MQTSGNWRPGHYQIITRSYAVIEKEALAAIWACKKSDYILGMRFVLRDWPQTSCATSLHNGFIQNATSNFEILRFSPKVVHVQGKDQITTDTLSCAPDSKPTCQSHVQPGSWGICFTDKKVYPSHRGTTKSKKRGSRQGHHTASQGGQMSKNTCLPFWEIGESEGHGFKSSPRIFES